MDDEEGASDSKINFVPCVTWVRRGVARPEPERVKLTQEELAAVISQTKVMVTVLVGGESFFLMKLF